MQTKIIKYSAGETMMEGYLAFNEKNTQKLPVVLIVHDWTGRSEFVCKKAEKLAELGYIGFAVDMYGDAKLGKDNDEKAKLMTPLKENRELLKQRILAAFNEVKKIENVDTTKIAAIGYCFGGLCVLDLARSGADVKGVVSFHGVLTPPSEKNSAIKAKILAIHGFKDPMVPSEEVWGFEKEMAEANADWQLNVYGTSYHSFTNPQANDPNFGTVYNADADRRSWLAMQNFFTEIFN